MKKSFLLIAALLMLGSTMFAQDLDLGVKIGYQTPNLSYQKADIKSGFQNHLTFGIFGRVEYGMLYVQPEVLYFKTNNIFSLDVANTSQTWLPEETVTFTLNEANLQVPILVGVKFLDLGVATLRAQVGPTANFTLASTTLFDKEFKLINDDDPEHVQEMTLEDDSNIIDTKAIAWGMQAGLGADILGKITLDINYNFGLSKVFGNLNNTNLGNYFDFSNVDNTKQSLFMVTVGYKFL
ncbi:MAG: PorT family protein [Bacteroidales bacterium]|nr:PorT family protein [Bacteroidales bacterium]